jgi:hypothetical protein
MITKRSIVTTASAFMLVGLASLAPASAQVSKTRMDDGAILTTTTPAAGTTLIYSNFGKAGSVYNPSTGWTEAGAEANDFPLAEAMAFTVSSNYILVRIDMGITYLQGTNGMTLVVAEDNGGVPGNIIYSAPLTNLPSFGTCCALMTADLPHTKANHVGLSAGQQYWLYPLPADTTSYLIWNLDVTNKGGVGAVSKDLGVTWTPTTYTTFGAFNLYGYR